MPEHAWFDQIKKDMREILEIVNDCEEPYKGKCFEILLTHAVQEKGITAEGAGHSLGKHAMKIKQCGGKIDSFLTQNNLTLDDLSKVVDLETGDILTTALGTKNAEVQRRLAVLIAMYHLAKEGALVVPKDELKTKCIQSGIYAANNFAYTMKKTRYKSTVVFQDDPSGWKVTSPALGYVADMLKSMIQ